MIFPRLSKIKNRRGIALFMVLTAMTVLSVIATELAYVSQVNQRMAHDSMDQIKALYLAKSGLKISLLRLKVFQNLSGPGLKEAGIQLPKSILDKIWNFPFLYPFPSSIPGIDPTVKEGIEKFQKESALEGSFTAVIESESSKVNLNMVLGPYAAQPSASATSTGTNTSASTGTSTGTGTSVATFNPENARKGLQEIINQMIQSKEQSDPEFQEENRDFKIDDLVDGIFAWSDASYERHSNAGREIIRPKRAPFYSVSELRMVYPISDKIYDLLAPNFTASTTPGINVNSMKEPMLKALVPGITADEIKVFFEFRDDPEKDNQFKKEEDFYTFLRDKIGSAGGQAGVDSIRDRLKKEHTVLVFSDEVFKITVQAQVNQAIKVIEAWVKLDKLKDKKDPTINTQNQSKTGLKITFMRIL